MGQIIDALDNLPPATSEKPTVLIARTVKGKGVSFMEKNIGWHAGALSHEDTQKAMGDIDADFAGERSAAS
jgi:transketolase